jgi:hypothetical protein
MVKATKKAKMKHSRSARIDVDTVDKDDIFAALFAQDVAVETMRASRTINKGIAKQLRKGAAMIPGYEFDWNRMLVKKAS